MKKAPRKSTRKVAVITGASAGVGRATVREFAAHGYDIGLIARGVDGLEGAREEVEAAGGRALVLPLDVSDADALERATDRVEAELGPIDVWVNDAMVSVFAPVLETTPEEFRHVTEVTYLGTVYGTLAALRRMNERDRGVIVQVSSALAYRSIPLQSAYCAAKHAILGFTESLRTELLHEKSGVQVTLVHLPAVNTPQFEWSRSKLPNRPQPVPPIYQPEVPARAIRYAAEHPRKEFDLGYPAVKAILGEKFASGYADRYLAKTGYDSQQTDEPVSPNRRENFWAPVPGDAGAHGRFDDRARDSSWEFWLDTHRGWIAAGAAVVGLGALTYANRKRSRTGRHKLAHKIAPRPPSH